MTTFTHLFLGPGRVTLAIREGLNSEVSVGIAWCSPGDQFSRALGRATALMPLDHANVTKKGFGFSFTSKLKKGSSILRLKDEAVSRLIFAMHDGSITVPSWARKELRWGTCLFNVSNKTYSLYVDKMDKKSVIVRENSEVTYSL